MFIIIILIYMKTPPLYLIGSFLAFCDSKNMTEAAQTLGLSQPALTAHLKSLEEYFPQDVFEMEGRKKVLTPFGQELRDILSVRFGSLDAEIKSLNENYQSSEKTLLRVAGRAEILGVMAPQVKFPGTLIYIDVDGETAVQGLIERRFDLAISNHLRATQGLHGKKLFSDRCHLVYPRKWGLEASQISQSLFQSLRDRPYLSYKESDPFLEPLLKHHKVKELIPISRSLSNWQVLLSMVEMNQGWTVAPTSYIPDSNKVVSLPIPTSVIPETEFFCLYRKETASRIWFTELFTELKKVRA